MSVETYKGVKIHLSEDGYHASAGISDHFGYADRIEDIRAEIDDYWADQEPEPQDDTPALDTSFHDIEMAGEDDDSYPGACSNPRGHSWVCRDDNEEISYCENCGADGNA